MNRRQFLKATAATAAASFFISTREARADKNSPNNKLNIALIGVGGRGTAHYDWLADENVVALCDVNETHFDKALKRFPKAKTYVDWRQVLDQQKDLNAVCVCTADHTHAFIANWALNRNLHVYLEKPLGISVEEARVVRTNWLKRKDKLATQVGMQRHAMENFNRLREMIRDGAIGDFTSASAWGDRQIRRPGYPAAEGTPPAGLHYDLWLGPSPEHPYSPSYFAGGCLAWNMYWDFGAGQVGDMGSHTMDLLWNAVDAVLPTSAEAKGEAFNPDVTPVEAEMHFEHPANDWRGPIKVSWYQGGALPTMPANYVEKKKIGHGAIFQGSKASIVADFGSHTLVPNEKGGDLSYYKPRPADKMLPPVGHFQKQWVAACKNGGKTACDFEYSANMIEQMLLGLVAYRVGKKIHYNGAEGLVTDSPEANALLKRNYRKGWTLDG